MGLYVGILKAQFEFFSVAESLQCPCKWLLFLHLSFSITILRGILIRTYKTLFNNKKNLNSGKGKTPDQVLQEFCQLRDEGHMWVNYNWDNWIAFYFILVYFYFTSKNFILVFYFSLPQRIMSLRLYISGPGINLIWCFATVVSFIYFLILSNRCVLTATTR